MAGGDRAPPHVGPRFVFQDNLTTMDAYTTADAYAFVDIPGRDVALAELKIVRGRVKTRCASAR
jgi:iron complex outermembrane recepter protein